MCSVIRVLAYDRKGPGFDSLSRARTWVASSVPSTLTTHGGNNQYVSHICLFRMEEGQGRGKVPACERESHCKQFWEANGERVSILYFVYFCII